MNRHVNAIAGRLSLRQPQRRSLEILDRITEIVPPRKGADIQAALQTIKSEFPTVTDFERDFPSLCFALATGVGKTRLMGAFISYLHLAHGMNHFFVLAPNLTIYNKLITDFTPNTPKYVFKGIAEFAVEPPLIITGDNYESGVGVRKDTLPGIDLSVHVNIFNISKINSEVRGGRSPRIKRLSEYIGESYFEYLAELDDLVLLMDESHRYRASAGVRAINELNPVLGLELTATPIVETAKGAVSFKNVIFDYPLAKAMADGFVKEPAVVTQKNFDPKQFNAEQIEQIKLEDGVRLHENTKVELETYARQTEQQIVKPFMLIIARDTTHASQLIERIRSDTFFEGRYKDKVIQVDSSKTGTEEDEMVARLLKVESPDEPTEIVIHVNMLKEGWDVTNLYTIVPLRAANARVLIEQSIGRGLRLPYGKRTGVASVDRLNIVAHDRFQEIIDEANKPDSNIRLQQVILDPATDVQRMQTVVVQPILSSQIRDPINFANEDELAIALATETIIKKYEQLPGSNHLLKKEIQDKIAEEVAEYISPMQQALPEISEKQNLVAVVAKMAKLVVQQTIDIPRIFVVPKGQISVGFNAFTLDCSSIRYQPVERDLLIQHLRTNAQETLEYNGSGENESRLEDYLVRGLIDFDDISYEEHADILYTLAGQVVKHLQSYLSEDDTKNVLLYHQKQLASFIHAQMQAHQWEKATDYEVIVNKGFTELKSSAFTNKANEPVHDFRNSVEDRTRIGQMLFGGFKHCLYPIQKFHSDTERKLAIILDRETKKWFRPAVGQFHISYKVGVAQGDYVPDFVAEVDTCIYMVESKARNEMESAEVLAKKDAAIKWCAHASTHATDNGGKPWKYVLVPHDAVMENMSIAGIVSQYGC
ncbi:MAG: DEAD/DEAH box helicase family protein [Nitrospirota bacterium]